MRRSAPKSPPRRMWPRSLNDYKGNAAVEEGEVFDPSPANIEARAQPHHSTRRNEAGAAAQEDPRRNGHRALSLHFGDEKSLFGQGRCAQMAGALLMRGTKKHNRQQIQDEMDRLKAQMCAAPGWSQRADHHSRARQLPRVAAAGGRDLAPALLPRIRFRADPPSGICAHRNLRTDPQAIATNRAEPALAPYPVGRPALRS